MQTIKKVTRDYTSEVNLEFVNKLMDVALKDDNYHDVRTYEGVLLDSHIIYDTKDIRIGKLKPRKYIIIKSVYVNEWSSKLVMTLTDKDDLVSELEQLWDDWEREEAEEENNY